MTVLAVDNNLIKVYDSLYRCMSTFVSMQVASMMKSTFNNLICDFALRTLSYKEG